METEFCKAHFFCKVESLLDFQSIISAWPKYDTITFKNKSVCEGMVKDQKYDQKLTLIKTVTMDQFIGYYSTIL
jgi:hypothetical protein